MRFRWHLRVDASVTLLVRLVSEIFVGSVHDAAQRLGMTLHFVGFIVVALVGGAAEMTTAFSAARANRLDLSVGIALGSGRTDRTFRSPGSGARQLLYWSGADVLQFWPGAVAMMLVATMAATLLSTVGVQRVCRRHGSGGLCRIRTHAVSLAAST